MNTSVITSASSEIWPEVRRVFRVTRVCLHLLYGFSLALLSGAMLAPHRPLVRRITQHWFAGLLVILRVDVQTRGTLSPDTTLAVSNHVSWLDIPVIGAHYPVSFLSKAEVRQWPLIGQLAASAGTLFIRRGRGEVRRKAEEIASHLAAQRSVLIFPEGTSTSGEDVKRFFSPLFAAATIAQTPVQPIAIRYTDMEGRLDAVLAFVGEDSFHQHLWRLLRRDQIRVSLSFCEPVSPEDEDDAARLAQVSRSRICQALAD